MVFRCQWRELSVGTCVSPRSHKTRGSVFSPDWFGGLPSGPKPTTLRTPLVSNTPMTGKEILLSEFVQGLFRPEEGRLLEPYLKIYLGFAINFRVVTSSLSTTIRGSTCTVTWHSVVEDSLTLGWQEVWLNPTLNRLSAPTRGSFQELLSGWQMSGSGWECVLCPDLRKGPSEGWRILPPDLSLVEQIKFRAYWTNLKNLSWKPTGWTNYLYTYALTKKNTYFCYVSLELWKVSFIILSLN